MDPKLQQLSSELDQAAANISDTRQFMQTVCQRIHDELLKYNWVGFYMIDPGDSNMLDLGPFVGTMTPHTRIPLNQGICGAAASIGKTIVVNDVSSDPRYLACSLETKSEIVAPVFVQGKVVGEIDIDSHFASAFSAADREFVEHCAALVGRHMERST